MRSVVCLSLALLLPLLAVSAPVLLAQDPGVPRERIELRELWNRGSDTDELFFGNIDRIVGDGKGNVYALDAQLSEVLVFSSDGELLRTIGGPGEGPGEFNQAADVFYGLGDKVGVLQAFPGKIIQLDPTGHPLDNFRLPEQQGGGFQVILRAQATADRLVLSGTRQSRSGGQAVQVQYLEAYAPDGERITQFHAEENDFQFGGMKYVEPTFVSFQRRWAAAPDGRVMAPLSYHEYSIHVWKPDGTLERVIERKDHTPLERTDEQMEITQQLFDAITSFNPRSTFQVSELHPAIAEMFAREDGELWVTSSRGIYARPEGCALLIDVFDVEGRFVRQIELMGDLDPAQDAVYLIGDRLYVVTDALSAAMSALGGGEGDADPIDVEPSTIVCFELAKTE